MLPAFVLAVVEINDPMLLVVAAIFILTFVGVCAVAYVVLAKRRRDGEQTTWQFGARLPLTTGQLRSASPRSNGGGRFSPRGHSRHSRQLRTSRQAPRNVCIDLQNHHDYGRTRGTRCGGADVPGAHAGKHDGTAWRDRVAVGAWRTAEGPCTRPGAHAGRTAGPRAAPPDAREDQRSGNHRGADRSEAWRSRHSARF